MTAQQRLIEFLAQSYRLQVFDGGDVQPLVEKYKKESDDEFLRIARARLSELDKLGAVVNLSQRDFAGYQQQKALRKLLGKR
jgi:hypothetical protein